MQGAEGDYDCEAKWAVVGRGGPERQDSELEVGGVIGEK